MIHESNKAFIMKARKKGKRIFAMLTAFCVALVGGMFMYDGAGAQGTTIAVQIKGLLYDMSGSWNAVPLSVPVDVLSPDGERLGTVSSTADALALNGISSVILKPAEDASIDGFIFAGDSRIDIKEGQANLATVFAYAEQGLFSVDNVLAGSGASLSGAEYAVLNASGEVLLSFAVNENGAYSSEQMLPSGEYSLVEMRAAQGVMPAPTVPFTISAYTGSEGDIAHITVESAAIPELSPEVGRLELSIEDFVLGDNGLMYGTVNISGICDASNDMPLRDIALNITAAGLRDADGGAADGGEYSFTELSLAGGSRLTAAALDSSGAELDSGLSLAGGQFISLPEGTHGLRLSFAYGDAALPTGYDAGALALKLAYAPKDGTEPSALQVSAGGNAVYMCPGADNMSFIDASRDFAPISGLIKIPDRRAKPVIAAEASSKSLKLTASPNSSISDTTPVIIELPQGVRASEQGVDCELLLRMRDSDAVLIDWARLTAGYTLSVRFGSLNEVTVYLPDECGLAQGEDNPFGASLLGDSYRKDALWDALIGERGRVYTGILCPLTGAISLDALESYDYIAASGRLEGNGGAASSAVMLRGRQDKLCYGDYVEADGSFAVYAPQPSQYMLDKPLDLLCVLPEGAVEASTGAGEIYTAEVTMPATGLSIRYSRKSALGGIVADELGNALQGVAVSLSQNGSALGDTFSDANGAFRFADLESGDYELAAHGGELLIPLGGDGFALSEHDGSTAVKTVHVDGEQDVTVNVAAKRAGAVKGIVTLNGAPLAGFAAELAGDSGERLTSITDESGEYGFFGLGAGSMMLGVTPPESSILISVGSQALSTRDGATVPLIIVPGKAETIDIAFESTASLYGGSDELGAGMRVIAASVGMSTETETDQGGSFRFDGLQAGDYSVYIELPEGKELSADCEWKPTENGDMGWHTASPNPGEALELAPLSFTAFTGLDGFAFMDTDSNGARGEDESLLTGVPVSLKRFENGGWTDVADIKTNEYGKFSFDMLPSGDYSVFSNVSASGLYVASIGDSAESDPVLGLHSAIIPLRDGERAAGVANIGLRQCSSLSLTAFVDSDSNGQQSGKERAIPGVLTELLKNGEVLYSDATDEGGSLAFDSVIPDEYALRVTPPVGYALTARGAGNLKSSEDGLYYESEPMLFAAGQTVETGIGLSQVGSFSGKVFEDVNNNGIMDENEPGVAGVTLRLRGKKGGVEFELVTDETGLYVFSSLPDDVYIFTAILPDGMLLARYSKDGGDLRSVFTGDTTAREFAVKGAQHVDNKNIGVIERGVVDGVVFLDLNYNGLMDEGEPGVSGVTLELIRINSNDSYGRILSDDNGAYRFDNLRLGDYRLRAILPVGGGIFTKVTSGENANLFEQRESRRENSIQPVTVASGSVTHTLVGVAVGASISGTVYQDEDYSGTLNGKEKTFSGIRVRLMDELGAEVASVSTAAGGVYSIDGIMPGVYTVEVARKPGYGFTRLRPNEAAGSHIVELVGEYGVTAPITVAMGDAIGGINAGMLPSATVSGVLFEDLNDDGMRGDDEGGMTDATVRLTSEDGEIDLVREVAPSGEYFFDGVMPGSYTMTFRLPEHAELAITAAGGNTLVNQGRNTVTSAFGVEMGQSYAYPLVGAVRLGSFEGFVFHDINADGVPDAQEERMAGVELTLAPERAELSAKSASTGADGSYSITGLRPSQYKLEVKLPKGFILSHDLSEEGIAFEPAEQQAVDCPWQALISRAQKPIGAVKPAAVSGVIWLDENRDGTRASGEALMSGVSVELVSSDTGMVAKRVKTGENGYTIDAVRPGEYRLRFAMPAQAEPAGEAGAAFKQNGEYMVCDGVRVEEDEAIVGLDVGLVSRATIGGKVWLDEGGQSSPVAGMSIALYPEGSAEPLQTSVTSDDGEYSFIGLWPGEYRIEAEKPSGTVFVKPDDANYDAGASTIQRADGIRGMSDTITLQMARDQTSHNIIFIKPAKVGDMAWIDENRNGLVDAGERRLAGVTVSLAQNGQTAYETVTDANGYYLLEDVYPGAYTLTAKAYPQLEITRSVEELRMISSCLTSGNGDEAVCGPFDVVSGSNNKDFDLGYILRDGQRLPELPAPDTRDWTGANTKELPKY